MKTKYLNLKDNDYNIEYIDNCVTEFKNGNVGIIPTDTVYGIACDALNIQSLERLYLLKHRSYDKPINILVSNISMVNKFVKNINPIEQKIIENFWPGPITIIFDKSQIVPSLLNSNLDTIGIRMPNNKVCLDILNKFNTPIATSSANISDNPPAVCIEDIMDDFNNRVDFIFDVGKLNSNSIPSTIIRIDNNKIKILRPGPITIDDINKILEEK